ncbi:MAG: sigma-54 dependent transcriptional regulator [Moraxellaceae bacterium]|nr:sigma-54 dependent transcriptional regulator [Moraxellaceae bacterium]
MGLALNKNEPVLSLVKPVLPLGSSSVMQAIHRLIKQVANHNTVVLIQGESGSGKEVVARAIHEHSDRSGKPFVPVNCGAIPADLLESELFGHEKGAFTGAISTRKGRFEIAEGGTLFLDEIGDMSMPMQVKLLRVLQERCFERVGSNQTIKSNVRIIAATHRDLEGMIEESKFRQDLFFRLNVFPIVVPPLRDRCDDIPALIDHFNARLLNQGKPSIDFSQSALNELLQYPWPGNIRELENLVERLAIMQSGNVVRAMDLPAKYRSLMTASEDTEALSELLKPMITVVDDEPVEATKTAFSQFALPTEGIDLKQYLIDLECKYIEEALRCVDGVVSRAAKLLGLQRTTLVEKMKKLNIQAFEMGQ